MEKINLQKIKLVETFVNFYLSKDKVSDKFFKSDIEWFATGLTMTEFEACKAVAKDLFMKEVSKNDN
tara:strand:+ start:863 stop:1063 length:201 start_codon:yes stop_codon:yes gene_type:complete